MAEYKLIHYNFENDIILSDQTVNVLIIESGKQYTRYVSELFAQLDGGDGEFMIYCEGKEVSLSKVALPIFNIFTDIFSDKRIMNAIYKKFEQIVQSEECWENYCNMQSQLYNYLLGVIDVVDIAVELGEFSNVTNLLKTFDLHVCNDYNSLLEKLVDFVTLVAKLNLAKVLVFFGLQNALEKNDLTEFYRHCLREKVPVLDVESVDRGIRLADEHITIIDKDLCEILIFN